MRIRSPRRPAPTATVHRVVVVGGGFAGLQAVRALRRLPVAVTLIDRRNFHLFSPLVYQVATGSLSAGEVATPLRTIFARDHDVDVVLGEVTDVDVADRRVLVHTDGRRLEVAYDTLIVAAGSRYAYHGHDDWRPYAPSIKTLDGALDVRRRVLRAFEAAELERDPDRRAAWLTFVVVGGGPTGVELAGQLAELVEEAARDGYRAADGRSARVVLVELDDRLLGTFPPSLSRRAGDDLRAMGVTTRLGTRVVDVGRDGVVVQGPDGAREGIEARTVVWAAGVEASPLGARLAARTGAERDRAGRITVDADLSLPGRPEILVVGDMARVRRRDGRVRTYPGTSPVAMQQGRHAARVVRDRLHGRAPRPFRFLDRGNVATIGRGRAVVDLRGVRLHGFPAWLFWLALHLYYLVGFENRMLVVVRWAWGFATRARGARLITGDERPDADVRALARGGELGGRPSARAA